MNVKMASHNVPKCEVVSHLTKSSCSATSSSLLERGALRNLATRSLYQQTVDHFPNFAPQQNVLTSRDAQVDLALHVWSARITRTTHLWRRSSPTWLLQTRRWQATRFHHCVLGWTLLSPGRARKASSLNVRCAIAAKLALASRRRMAAFLLAMLCC